MSYIDSGSHIGLRLGLRGEMQIVPDLPPSSETWRELNPEQYAAEQAAAEVKRQILMVTDALRGTVDIGAWLATQTTYERMVEYERSQANKFRCTGGVSGDIDDY